MAVLGCRKAGECDLEADSVWQCRDLRFQLADRPLIMGILNVTPDSFSDGGCYYDCSRAVEHGLQMVRDGADIIDIGGESTRPGADDVPADVELGRVMPVVMELARHEGVVVSIDTAKSEVAEKALCAGARIVNDVSALSADARMAEVARFHGAGVILMHMKGSPRTMQRQAFYEDVVRDVLDYLSSRLDHAERMGIFRSALVIDPGIGFGKTAEHNVALLAHLRAFLECRRPVAVGVSRKTFIGKLTGRDVHDRLAGTLGALAFCIGEGARILRVHDVKAARDVMRTILPLLEEKNRVTGGIS